MDEIYCMTNSKPARRVDGRRSSHFSTDAGNFIHSSKMKNVFRHSCLFAAISSSLIGTSSAYAAYMDIINDDQIVTVTATQNPAWTMNNLWVGNTTHGTLLIEGGGNITSLMSAEIGRLEGATGVVEMSGLGSAWTIGDLLSVGYSGDGRLTMSGGSVVNVTNSSYLGYSAGSSGVVEVSGIGTQWNTVTINLGFYGEGSLTINDGGKVTNTGLGIIGDRAGSSGIAMVSTGGLWDITQSLFVGRYGTGMLTISEGGVVNSATMNTATGEIGMDTGTTGIVKVSDVGSQWNNYGDLVVGSSGNGRLTISEGGVVNNAKDIYIGRYAAGSGLVEVSDSGSQLNSTKNLYVGNSASGELNIDHGGVVGNIRAYIGYNAGSTGIVRVSDVGSQWNSDALIVGNYGTGTLTIDRGGVVNNTTGNIAQNDTSGLVTVSGTGSQWNNSGSLVVGHSGTGKLTIDQGGAVSNTTAFVASNTGSTGVVEISGSGSLWNNSSTLYVGHFGNGTLTLADRAQVSTSAINLAMYNGSTGSLNIGDGNLAGTLTAASITGGAGSATVNFNHTDDIDFSPSMTGKLAVNHLTGGTTRLLAANSYTGATTISAGTLQAGALNTFSSVSNFAVGTGGQLDLAGYDQTLTSLNNAGVVSFNGAPGVVLTVTGDYTGNNGLLNFNTALNDDISVTDKLIVEGNTFGTTRVSVANAGGSGAATLNGIELVQVNGTSDGEFVQHGRIVAGAYDYTLARGADVNASNWYLTSAISPVIPILEPIPIPIPTPTPDPGLEPDPTPDPGSKPSRGADPAISPTESTMVERPEASGYAANLAAANNLFVTRLHDRLGETQYIDALTGEQKVTGLWLRNEGGHTRFRDSQDQLKTRANRYVMQLGGDIAQWSSNDQNRLHLGVMAGYANSKSRTESHVSGYSARAAIDGYSAGLYGTWYANEVDKTGLYVDTWALYNWFNNRVDGQYLHTEEYKSSGVTASVESGYTFKVGENKEKNTSYFIQPKAQVTWMGVKADDHKEANGTNVSGEGDGNIQTRLGVRAFMNGYSDQDKGKDRVFQPFIEANWIHNTQEFGTKMDGITVKQDGAANIGELKLGVEGQINKQLNLWGNVGQQMGDKGYSDTAVIFGVKYNF